MNLLFVYYEISVILLLQQSYSLFQPQCFLGLIINAFKPVKNDCLFRHFILLTNDLGLGVDTL